jgi:RNase P subunit RPR2
MQTPLPDTTCPNCDQETLEQRSRKDELGHETLFIVCAKCGHQPNLFDVSKQQIKKTNEAKKKSSG